MCMFNVILFIWMLIFSMYIISYESLFDIVICTYILCCYKYTAIHFFYRVILYETINVSKYMHKNFYIWRTFCWLLCIFLYMCAYIFPWKKGNYKKKIIVGENDFKDNQWNEIMQRHCFSLVKSSSSSSSSSWCLSKIKITTLKWIIFFVSQWL